MTAVDHLELLTVEEGRDLLVNLLHDWRAQSLLTTTAGVKSALIQVTEGRFDERNWGYQTFREFLSETEHEGRIQLHRLPTNHWLILLPGESPEDVVAAREQQTATRRSTKVDGPGGSTRFKSEVWIATVTWLDDHRRLWDRHAHRAFVYPVDETGAPAFVTQRDRFVEIPSADIEVQRVWMHEWAETLSATDRENMLRALASTTPGKFRQELERRGLTSEWSAELRARVAKLLWSWAENNSIAVSELIDPRPSRTRSDSGSTAAVGATQAPVSTSATGPGPDAQITAQLRARLHNVIDRMSLQELMSMPVAAAYLLDD